MSYTLTQADKDTALRLAESCTYFSRLEHLQCWQSAPDTENRKPRELAIAEYAAQLPD